MPVEIFRGNASSFLLLVCLGSLGALHSSPVMSSATDISSSDGHLNDSAFVQQAVGWAAVVATLFYFAAPIKDVFGENGIVKTRTNANLATGFPYFASFYNCALWVMYAAGDLPKLMQPLAINILGVSLQLSFLTCYWYYATEKDDLVSCRRAFFGGAFIVVVAFAVCESMHSFKPFGDFAMAMNIIMYYSPLAAFATVVREKSVARMPLAPLVLTLVCSLLWLTYGYMIRDVPIMTPNACGVLLGIAQLSVYAYFSIYYGTKRPDDVEANATAEANEQQRLINSA